MSQIAVIAKLPAAEGKRAELAAALQAMLDATESEPGTKSYILHEDQKDENLLWMYELYSDADALKAHQGSEAMKTIGPSLAGLFGGAPEMFFLNAISGKGL
jgi:quinol monooxygenase YgiN